MPDEWINFYTLFFYILPQDHVQHWVSMAAVQEHPAWGLITYATVTNHAIILETAVQTLNKWDAFQVCTSLIHNYRYL